MTCVHKVRWSVKRPENCRFNLSVRRPEKCMFNLSVSRYKDRIIVPDEYSGATVVTPSDSEQILPTKDKLVHDDITVEAIKIEPVTFTENGDYFPPSDTDGFSEVIVDVQPDLRPLSVTENGAYRPDGFDGYSEVTVNNPAQWTTDNIMNNLEPSGDLVIESAVDIPQYGMCRRDGITSLRFTSADPVNLGQHAFDTSKNIKSVFINRLGTMEYYAFAYATELLEIAIKNATDAVFGNYICRNTKCTTVKINGTPATMTDAVLKNNGNLRSIYVSWSEGVFDNAPWGLTDKATVYYDTIFDEDMNVVSYSSN